MHPQFSTALIERLWSRVVKTDGCWLYGGADYGNKYGGLGAGPGTGLTFSTHHLAWLLAGGPPIPDGWCILHICDVRNCVRNDDWGTYTVAGAVRLRIGHLCLGTYADNTRDAVAKGRALVGDRSWQRQHPELLPRGDAHWMRRYPERIARGDRSGARLHPESLPRGDNNPSRRHPERLARGDQHGLRLHPEAVERGTARYNAKLTDETVRAIRARSAAGARQIDLAAEFGVSKRLIAMVVRREAWRHVS